MKPEDFDLLKVSESGVYRLVPDIQLKLIAGALDSPSSILKLISTYGILIKMFRGLNDLTRSSLTSKAKIERKTLYLLEEGITKNPESETHLKLVKVFGKEFDTLARELKLFTDNS